MHELDGDDFASVAGGDGRLISDGMRRLAGAAVFAALVVGLGLWAYRLGTRDATEVPIIRAMEGPARVAPDDPGGLQAAHQGLEVNAVLAGRPAPEPTATAATLPDALTGEDAPQGELVQAAPAALAARVLAEEAGTASSGPAPRDAAVAIVAPADLAPADPIDADLTVAALPADPLIGDGAPVAALPADDDGAAVASSASPRPRPAGLVVARAKPAAAAPAAKPAAAEAPAARTASTPAAKPAAPAAPAASVSTASPRAGSRLVQLGAFDSESSTRKAWEQLVARNPDLLASKQLVAERATSNARVFYRLRVAGFDSSDQTRQMCEALRARGIDCIPVTVQ